MGVFFCEQIVRISVGTVVIYNRKRNDKVSMDDKIVLPTGWFAMNDLEKTAAKMLEHGVEYVTVKYLPEVAEKAEKIIHVIKSNASIEVPESYIKLSGDNAFLLLLLVSKEDYHSPQMFEAKYIANTFLAHVDFDVRINFSILEEHIKNKLLHPEQYLLKHLEHRTGASV